MPAAGDRPWALYLLECTGNRTYLGISPDPEQRFQTHAAGRGSMFTRLNRPQRIELVVWFECRRHAAVMERALKGLHPEEKRAWLTRWQTAGAKQPVAFDDAHREFTLWQGRR